MHNIIAKESAVCEPSCQALQTPVQKYFLHLPGASDQLTQFPVLILNPAWEVAARFSAQEVCACGEHQRGAVRQNVLIQQRLPEANGVIPAFTCTDFHTSLGSLWGPRLQPSVLSPSCHSLNIRCDKMGLSCNLMESLGCGPRLCPRTKSCFES